MDINIIITNIINDIINTNDNNIINDNNINGRVTDITFQSQTCLLDPPFSVHIQARLQEGQREGWTKKIWRKQEWVTFSLYVRDGGCELTKESWTQEFVDGRYKEHLDKVPMYVATYTLTKSTIDKQNLKNLCKQHGAEFLDLSDISERLEKKLYEKRR